MNTVNVRTLVAAVGGLVSCPVCNPFSFSRVKNESDSNLATVTILVIGKARGRENKPGNRLPPTSTVAFCTLSCVNPEAWAALTALNNLTTNIILESNLKN